jgi:hypothetical protein
VKRAKAQKSYFIDGSSSGMVHLSRSDIISCLESEARRRCNLSAQQFLKRANTGRLRDAGAVADLLSLAKLLRKNDPILRSKALSNSFKHQPKLGR